jgi:uncharacterized protein (TIGR00251 family)
VDVPIEIVASGARASVLAVRAQPNARRERCAGSWNGMLAIAVNAPPERGRANERVRALLAEWFELRVSDVEIVAGESSRAKKFRIALPLAAVRARVAEILIDSAAPPKRVPPPPKRVPPPPKRAPATPPKRVPSKGGR